MSDRGEYKVKVYVKHGYYQYKVRSMDQAISHAEEIMRTQTYRRENDGHVEFHSVIKVKVCGSGLESEYKDEFFRT